jgi:hypothetical protein
MRTTHFAPAAAPVPAAAPAVATATRRTDVRARAMALAVVAALSASPAAAAIVWSAPVDSTGKSTDVINTGELLDAGTFGAATTVNGVTFNQIGLGAPNNAQFGVLSDRGQFGAGWDPEYRTLVASTAYLRRSHQLQLGFGVLPVGEYVMQLFLPQWDVNWATAFSLNGVQSAPVQAGGVAAAGTVFAARAMPQWISVQFDADGVTDYTLSTQGLTTFQLLAAYQLRTAPTATVVPEPSTWAVMILGFGLAGATLRRGRRRQAAAPV